MNGPIVRLGRNSLIYGLGTVLVRFINLLLLPLFTAYLTPGDYGVLGLLAMLALVGQPVFSLGLSAAMGPSYFDGNDARHKSETVWTAFLILLVSAALLTAIGWLWARPLSVLALRSPDYGPLVSLTVTGCAVGILSTPFTQRIQFEEKAKTFVAIILISSLVSVALSVETVVILHWGVKGMVISQLLGQAGSLLLFLVAGARRTQCLFSRTIARELLRLGIPLMPSFMFLFVLMQSTRYILEWFRGLDEVGIYSVGFNMGMVMNLAVGAVATAWYPYFMSYVDRQDEAKVIFGRIFTYYVLFMGYLWLAVFIVAKPVVMIMTHIAFHRAYEVVGMSAGAYFFTGIYNLLLPAMYYQKEIAAQSLVQGIAATIAVGLNVLLIYWFGLLGAGLGLAIGHMLMALFTHGWNVYRRKDYLRTRFQWRRLLGYSPAFVVVPAVCLSLPPLGIGWEIVVSVGGLAALTLFTYLNLDESERGELSRVVGRVLPVGAGR